MEHIYKNSDLDQEATAREGGRHKKNWDASETFKGCQGGGRLRFSVELQTQPSFNNILRLPFSLIFLLYWTSATFFFLLLVLPAPPEK